MSHTWNALKAPCMCIENDVNGLIGYRYKALLPQQRCPGIFPSLLAK